MNQQFNIARHIIEATGLTVDQVAEKTGINRSHIGDYRSGRSRPSNERLAEMARVLGVQVVITCIPAETSENNEIIEKSK